MAEKSLRSAGSATHCTNVAGSLTLIFALTSCTMGSDFKRPNAPVVQSYTMGPQPERTADTGAGGGGVQRFSSQQSIPSDWWMLFKSEKLNALIQRGLNNSPTLVSAQARLQQAAELFTAQSGSTTYPQIDINGQVGRQKFSPAAFGFPGPTSTFNLYNASVSATYAFDFFGGARRQSEALKSQVDYGRFQLQGAYLTLTANIVTAALEIANRSAQISSTNEIIALEQEQLGFVELQLDRGTVALPDVVAQRASIAQTRATLPLLEKALVKAQHQLAVLVGDVPGSADIPLFTLDDFVLPQDLPLSLPADLVRQRPDILAAEAMLHRANARVGVATANLYPQLSLSASFGPITADAGDLFRSESDIWSIGARLMQPIFHGHALHAQRRAVEAEYAQAAADYQQAVLVAFQNVADVLRALEIDARGVQTQLDAAALARQSLELVQQQFQFGAVNYIPLVTAQRALQQSLLGVAQARATRYADTAALFQALGGGWWNRDEQKASSSPSSR
jgi:NodT family efflux transporter outer membrane factor (OMF) lipoprotein